MNPMHSKPLPTRSTKNLQKDLPIDFVMHLDLLIRARCPILYLVATEEIPVEEILEQVAEAIQPARRVYYWDVVGGWEDNAQAKASAMAALERVRTASDEPALFVLRDLHPVFLQPTAPHHYPVIRALKRLARDLRRTRRTIVLLSHVAVVPAELSEEMVVVDCPLPGQAEIIQILRSSVPGERLKLTELSLQQFAKACLGLTRNRIQRILACALAARQQVSEADIDLVLEEKRLYIRQTGLLEFFHVQDGLASVGGLEYLKEWVRERQGSFSEAARAYGLPNPKGVLLVGIQGTGKSLSAKTIAHEWRMPLLRLDAGRLFGSMVGESESRVRQMIQIAEALAPCVLWIDELDKAFGGIAESYSGDSGTSKRVFGSLITWMQEKTAPVFIVATANSVRSLPAELLRRGRFDEIFFLDLPTEAERREILRVHLERVRPYRMREFDLDALARQSPDFSGAELEQVVLDAMHRAFNARPSREFTQLDLSESILATVPLASIAGSQALGG
jgi:hypothetical protein